MKEYKTYLFDVDGTLIDTAELIYQCFLYSCKKFGNITVDRELVMNNIGLPFRPQLETYIGKQTDEKVEVIFEAHITYQKEVYSQYLRIFEGIDQLLEKLQKSGKNIGIVTSRKRDTLDLYLKEMDIYNYFDVIISPEDTEKHKPSPEPVLEALARYNEDSQHAIYIGDSVFDIESGDSAGCDTAFVEWSAVHHSKCHVKPTYVIANPSELY